MSVFQQMAQLYVAFLETPSETCRRWATLFLVGMLWEMNDFAWSPSLSEQRTARRRRTIVRRRGSCLRGDDELWVCPRDFAAPCSECSVEIPPCLTGSNFTGHPEQRAASIRTAWRSARGKGCCG
eukprot:1298895-Rhodomonas_salina.4